MFSFGLGPSIESTKEAAAVSRVLKESPVGLTRKSFIGLFIIVSSGLYVFKREYYHKYK